MTDEMKSDLVTAIELALEDIRPTSMQAKVLESMINRAPNGLPAMTYDLEVANEKFAELPMDFQVPTIWELIGLDVAPYPNLWGKVEYARDNAKAIRNAIYSLKEKFDMIEVPLYLFNPFQVNAKEVTVVTPDPAYKNAKEMTFGRMRKQYTARIQKDVNRCKLNGKNNSQIASEICAALKSVTSLPQHELGLRLLESGAVNTLDSEN